MPTEQELLIIARLRNEVSRPVKDIKRDFAGLSAEMQTQDKLTGAQTAQLRKLGSEMRSSQRDAKKLAQEFSDLGSKMTRFLTLPIAAVFGYSIQKASDLNEQVQKTNVVFGVFADRVHDLGRTAASSMGLSQRAFEQTTGSIGALLEPLGIGQRQAVQMSTTLTQLAADLASFYNTSTEDALAALQSGLVGQIRPLRRYGVELSQARLQEYAWANGIARSGQQLTQSQKQLAAYGVILQDTKLAQGDFARTSGGMANQTRIARAELENAAATLGEKLIPVGIAVLHVITGIADGFTSLPDSVQTFIVVGLGITAMIGPMLKLVGAWLKLKQAIEASRTAQVLFNRGAVAEAGASAAGGGNGGIAGLLAGGGGAAAGGVPVALIAAGVASAVYSANDIRNQAKSGSDISGRIGAALTTIGVSEGLNTGISLLGSLTGTDIGLKDVPVIGKMFEDGGKLTGTVAQLGDALHGTTSEAASQVRTLDQLTDDYSQLSKAVDDTAASYDAVLGKYLDAEDAQSKLIDNVQRLADDLMKGVDTSGLQSDVRDITRSIEANVIAQQKAGKIGSDEQSFFGAQITMLEQLKSSYPEATKQLDGYITKLQQGYDLAKRASQVADVNKFLGSLPFGLGRIYQAPVGDTATPRGWDGASYGDTLAIHAKLDQLVPGGRTITSGMRAGGSGDHSHGRALDLVGSNLAGYAAAVRKVGGFAEFHGSGAGRHLHVVPRTKAPASGPARSGPAALFTGTNVFHKEIDVEAAVARAQRKRDRDLKERT